MAQVETQINRAGRKPISLDMDFTRRLLAERSNTVLQIARILGVNRNTLYRHAALNGISIQRKTPCPLAFCVTCRSQLMSKGRSRNGSQRFKCANCNTGFIGSYSKPSSDAREYCADPEGKARTCKYCFEAKPLTAFPFRKEKAVYRHKCSTCTNASFRAWRHGNPRYRPARQRTPLTEVYPYMVSNGAEGEDLLTRINNLVPRNLPEAIRADACQAIALAVLRSEVELENLERHIKRYIRAQSKFMPSKWDISLDAPMFGDNAYRLGDCIDTETYNEGWARNSYSWSLADCATTEDLAERLNQAWEANRLAAHQRGTYSRFSASHEDDKRAIVTASQSSGGRYGTGSKFRHTRVAKAIPRTA